MQTMAVSKFKATCLAVLQRVKRTGRPIRITRFGEPIAEVVPPAPPEPQAEWMGSMRGQVTIEGDIVGSAVEPRDWSALRT